MDFDLRFVPDEVYYKEAYGEIISSLKYKKYEPVFALVMILLGIALYFQDNYKVLGIFPYIFIGFGAYELVKLQFEKRKWLKDRLDSKLAGQQIELQFTDETIRHIGPFSNGVMKWTGLKRIIKTKKGILIKTENGISIYLQNIAFADSAQIQFILSKG